MGTQAGAFHTGLRSDNSSGFKGVYQHPRTGRYTAYFKMDGVQRHLGYFDSAAEAAHQYDKAVRKFYGPDAVTNADLDLYS